MGGRAAWEPQPNKANDQVGDDRFEYDSTKSALNKEKHGIDFEEAKALWNDERRTFLPSPYSAEPRELMIGVYNGKHYTAIITYRGGTTRIISVRRSRESEVYAYEYEAD
jgi:uncharacterized DUF497 family protein